MGKIRKVSANGSEPVKASLTSQKLVGALNISVNSIDGWHTGSGEDDEVPFVIYAVKPTGEIVAGSQTSWMGVVSRSNSTINNLRLTGGQDQVYPVGSKVVATSTSAWANELAEALLVSHNPDGSLKEQTIADNSLDGRKIKNSTLDGSKIKNGTIDPGKLSRNIADPSSDIIKLGNLAIVRGRKYLGRLPFTEDYFGKGYRPSNEYLNIEFARAFKSAPVCVMSIETNGPVTMYYTGSNATTTRSQEFTLTSQIRTSDGINVTVDYIAIGELA